MACVSDHGILDYLGVACGTICCMTRCDETGFIVELDEREVFVFGSNGMGMRGAGAAAMAVKKFGAVYG